MNDRFPKLTSHTVGNFDSRLLAGLSYSIAPIFAHCQWLLYWIDFILSFSLIRIKVIGLMQIGDYVFWNLQFR
jgi:hypothetical protein